MAVSKTVRKKAYLDTNTLFRWNFGIFWHTILNGFHHNWWRRRCIPFPSSRYSAWKMEHVILDCRREGLMLKPPTHTRTIFLGVSVQNSTGIATNDTGVGVIRPVAHRKPFPNKQTRRMDSHHMFFSLFVFCAGTYRVRTERFWVKKWLSSFIWMNL